MRTTLDIDEGVLRAAKESARREHKTTGEVLSELARESLTRRNPEAEGVQPKAYFGLRPFPRRGGIVTNELVEKLRADDAGCP